MFDCSLWCHSRLQPSLPRWVLHSSPFCSQNSREIAHWILLTIYDALYIIQNSKTKLGLQTHYVPPGTQLIYVFIFFRSANDSFPQRRVQSLSKDSSACLIKFGKPSLRKQLKLNLIQSKIAKLKASSSVQLTPLFFSDEALRRLAAGY